MALEKQNNMHQMASVHSNIIQAELSHFTFYISKGANFMTQKSIFIWIKIKGIGCLPLNWFKQTNKFKYT